ncbi:hypothetical protein BJ912DRAFT_1052817 [Pholiota molesta]|nr:hypothetical protein BJ912DRAFT_1052817 [Pholiota molesta]
MGQVEVDLTDADRIRASPELNEVKEEPDDVSEPPTISPERTVIIPGHSFTEDNHHHEPSEPTTLQTLLAALREHVSNKMPIRLLCFTPDINGTKLLVSLLDRSGIYAHLASEIQSNFDEEQFLLEMKPYSIYHTNKTSAEREFIQEWVAKHARYAILSHTWLRTAPGEVTYSDWNKGMFDMEHAGYQKLVNFCKIASRDHGLTLGWMDTICINKESSTELDESIRSMYNWYRDSDLCITYLAETATLSDVHKDPWFTRGWTLQELLAPGCIKFYDMDWIKLISTSDNDKWDPTF